MTAAAAPNPYCDVLRIPPPSVEQLKDHREANHYGLLIVALLERGGPLSLRDVAERFEEGWKDRWSRVKLAYEAGSDDAGWLVDRPV